MLCIAPVQRAAPKPHEHAVLATAQHEHADCCRSASHVTACPAAASHADCLHAQQKTQHAKQHALSRAVSAELQAAHSRLSFLSLSRPALLAVVEADAPIAERWLQDHHCQHHADIADHADQHEDNPLQTMNNAAAHVQHGHHLLADVGLLPCATLHLLFVSSGVQRSQPVASCELQAVSAAGRCLSAAGRAGCAREPAHLPDGSSHPEAAAGVCAAV